MRYIQTPFATSGDRAVIPNAAQPSGDVSMAQGYGPDYSKDPETDPTAKRIERTYWNGLLNDVTTALKAWQDNAFPTWFPASDRSTGYGVGVVVRSPDDGSLFVSRVANNAALLTDAASWRAITLDVGSTTVAGLMRLATQAEVNAGTVNNAAVTPATLATRLSNVLAGYATTGQVSSAISAFSATLGSLAFLNSVNNGNWSGAALTIANGGTGAATAANARTNLGLKSGATIAITASASAPSGGTDGDIHFQI